MQKVTESNKNIFGYRLFVVISGSMIPKYDMGEVVVCKEIPVNEIKVGDDIVYKGKEGEIANKTIMHEVVSIEHDANNELLFYAKGLTNEEEDPTVVREQIYGIVKFKSKILTKLYKFATSLNLSFLILLLLTINVFISFKSGKDEDKEKKQIEGESGVSNQILCIENKEEKADNSIEEDKETNDIVEAEQTDNRENENVEETKEKNIDNIKQEIEENNKNEQ